MDQIVRDRDSFFGSYNEKSRLHLFNWDEICKEKQFGGGLGLTEQFCFSYEIGLVLIDPTTMLLMGAGLD